jgi:very-short-patch-repair endonuclease
VVSQQQLLDIGFSRREIERRLRYHRTPAEQARGRLRDQAHTAAGLTQLRFTHEQVVYEPDHVVRVLAATAFSRR